MRDGRRLQQLDQHAQRGGRLQKGDLAVGARARRLVDQLHALVLEVAQVLADVRACRSTGDAGRARGVRGSAPRCVSGIGRLEQLDQHVGRLDEGDFELALGQLDRIEQAQPELVAVEVHRFVDARHSHADVVNRQRRRCSCL